MKENLVQYLICPKCSNKFILKSMKKKSSEVLEGQLICSKKHKFPIKKGIPRLVVDKTKIFVKTEDSFSSKWRNYNKTYHTKKANLHFLRSVRCCMFCSKHQKEF